MLTIAQKRENLVAFELHWLSSESVGDNVTDTDIDQVMRYIDALYTSYTDAEIARQYSLKFED